MSTNDSDTFASPGPPEKADSALISAYLNEGVTADRLPYSESFERIYKTYCEAVGVDPSPSKADVWRRLLWLRKLGMLPRMRAFSTDENDQSRRDAV